MQAEVQALSPLPDLPAATPHPQLGALVGEFNAKLQRQREAHGKSYDTQAEVDLMRAATLGLVQRYRSLGAQGRPEHLHGALQLVQRSADREAMMRVSVNTLRSFRPGDALTLQRLVDEHAEQAAQARQAQQEREDTLAQRQAELEAELAPTVQRQAQYEASQGNLNDKLQSLRGGGTALPEAVQRQLQRRLHIAPEYLEKVRVHTGSEAHGLAKGIGALAATSGSDIFFQSGQYQPNSQSGLELLGHEVKHVEQQLGGRVQGAGIDPDAGLETEARAAGARLVEGGSAPTPAMNAALPTSTSSSVQRLNDPGAPAPLKQGETWERRFTGSKNGVTFHLLVYRYPDGRLAGEYAVEGGTGKKWHVSGSVREDGRFALWGDSNAAFFEGRYTQNNTLHVNEFRLGDAEQPRFELHGLELTREGQAGTKGEGAAPAPKTPPKSTAATPAAMTKAGSPTRVPKADVQAWTEAKRFVGQDERNTRFTMELERDSQGGLSGSYQANDGKPWPVRGELDQDGRFELRGKDNEARFSGRMTSQEKTITLHAHFEHAQTGYKSNLVLAQTRVYDQRLTQSRNTAVAVAPHAKSQEALAGMDLKALNAKYKNEAFQVRRDATGRATKQERQRVFQLIMTAAKDCGEPFPEVLAAQWALESSWGRAESGRNNLFGIKARKGEAATAVVTHEEDSHGRREQITDRFRDYESVVEGIKARVDLMRRNPAYAKHGYFTASTPRRAVQALKAAGYATDGSYVPSIVGVISGMGLDPDRLVVAQQPPSAIAAIPVLSRPGDNMTAGPKSKDLTTLMSKVILSPNEIAEARTLITRVVDSKMREDLYLQLQSKVPYHNQRNNASTERGKDIGDGMCNLTSLAMALETLGIDNPEPENFEQFEDYLEALRVRNKLPDRTEMSGWGGVAKAMGVTYKIVGGDVVKGHNGKYGTAWWREHVLPELRQGSSATMSITGHIVRLQDVREDGLVVDDPFGISRLDAGKGRGWSKVNKNTGPDSKEMVGAVGSDVLWTWPEVEQHVMHWIAIFSRR